MDVGASYVGSPLKIKVKARELGLTIKYFCRIDRAAWLQEHKDSLVIDGNMDYFSVDNSG